LRDSEPYAKVELCMRKTNAPEAVVPFSWWNVVSSVMCNKLLQIQMVVIYWRSLVSGCSHSLLQVWLSAFGGWVS